MGAYWFVGKQFKDGRLWQRRWPVDGRAMKAAKLSFNAAKGDPNAITVLMGFAQDLYAHRRIVQFFHRRTEEDGHSCNQ